MRADNLAAEGHWQCDYQSATRRISKAGQFGACSVYLFQNLNRMLVEQHAVLRQGEFTRTAQEQLQADILLQPVDNAAEA